MTGLRRLAAVFLAALALAFTAGCGSGGTGSSVSTTGGRAALDVFVTDGFTDQFKQVIATLFKIELTMDGTNFQTVFEDTAGRTLDLASLSSTAELLASVTVPAGTYTQARITFGDHITLVKSNGTSTSVAVDPSAGTDTNGQIAVKVSTPARVQTSTTNSVTVDFKLAEFTLVGNVLHPSISCGNGHGDNPGEQHTAEINGTVTNLNGTTSFVLQNANGRTITVALTSTTTITSGQTGTAIALANGQNVIVEGTFDPTTSTLTATSITLNDFTTIRRTEARGTVASVNTAAGSFVLTVLRAEGIMPTGGTITVVSNANTHFDGGRHDDNGTLANVTVGSSVEVNGSFDTTTQTLTARSVELH
jgi:Domain of unknown function (DUF4382)/Domain of unknown function (DUF5666)